LEKEIFDGENEVSIRHQSIYGRHWFANYASVYPGHFFDGKVAIAYAGNDDLTVAVFDPPKTIVDFSDA